MKKEDKTEVNDAFLFDLFQLGANAKLLWNSLSNLRTAINTQEQRFANFSGNKKAAMTSETRKFREEVHFLLRDLNISLCSLGLNTLDIDIDGLILKVKNNNG